MLPPSLLWILKTTLYLNLDHNMKTNCLKISNRTSLKGVFMLSEMTFCQTQNILALTHTPPSGDSFTF
jgi:hypothetical protein